MQKRVKKLKHSLLIGILPIVFLFAMKTDVHAANLVSVNADSANGQGRYKVSSELNFKDYDSITITMTVTGSEAQLSSHQAVGDAAIVKSSVATGQNDGTTTTRTLEANIGSSNIISGITNPGAKKFSSPQTKTYTITIPSDKTGKFKVAVYSYSYRSSDGSEYGHITVAASGNAHSTHTWNSGSITTQPTCAKEGVKTYTCTKCGATKTEAVKKKDHTWKDATCTAPKTCTVCGATSGSPLNHAWNAGVVTTSATCQRTGVKTYTCTRSGCGATTTETINKVAHSYTKQDTGSSHLASPATCTAAAQYYYSCTWCGANGTSTFPSGSKLDHDFSTFSSYNKPVITWATSGYTATYTQTGTKKCSRCTETKPNQTAVSATACTVTSAITAWPSYSATGTRIYYANATANGVKADQSTKSETLAKLTYTASINALNGAYNTNSTTTFSVTPKIDNVGQSTTYKWQVKKNNVWSDLTNSNGFSNVTSATLSFTPTVYDTSLQAVRCVATTSLVDPKNSSSKGSASVTSNEAAIWGSGSLMTFAPKITTDLTYAL